MKIVIDKKVLEIRITEIDFMMRNIPLTDDVLFNHRKEIKILNWLLDIAISLSDVVKPLLEEAYEEGFATPDWDKNYNKQRYISSLLEKLNQ